MKSGVSHYTLTTISLTIFINIKIISMKIMPWTLSSSCVSAFSNGCFITSSTHTQSHHHLHHRLTIRRCHTHHQPFDSQIIYQVQITVTENRLQSSFISESGQRHSQSFTETEPSHPPFDESSISPLILALIFHHPHIWKCKNIP